MMHQQRSSQKAEELAVFAATGLDTDSPHGVILVVLLILLTILFILLPRVVF
jgi:hypothetical protein